MRSLLTAVAIGLCACGGSKPNGSPVDQSVPADPMPATRARPAFRVQYVDGGNSIALEGVVADASADDLVIGATVLVTGPALAGERAQITDERGAFAMGALPPGTYEIAVYYGDSITKGAVEVRQGKRTKLEIDIATARDEVVELVPSEAAPTPAYATAYEALQRGALAQTIKLGEAEVAKAPSSKLHAMLAIARYGLALEAARYDLLAFGGTPKTGADIATGLAALSVELAKVQTHLAAAAQDAKFALELCVACMPLGGHMGLVPPGLFDIERDKQGAELPPDDARRRPTYRFDHGDIAWGRALVSYQQAVVSLALAYDWTWVDQFVRIDDTDGAQPPTQLTIRLVDARLVAKARAQLLAGLAASDEARAAYRAETDDDREWVPSPKQKSYAAPLAVDESLYRTWEDIVADVRALVAGETGISFRALWTIFDQREPPPGFLALGAMLAKPSHIVIDLAAIERIETEKHPIRREQATVALLQNVLGSGYQPQMKPSRLADRLLQLHKDMLAGAPAFADKLKYLFWLN